MRRVDWLKVAVWAWVVCWALLAVVDVSQGQIIGALKDMALGAFLTALIAGITAAYLAISRKDEAPEVPNFINTYRHHPGFTHVAQTADMVRRPN